ncbi:hypothetical protein F383_00837 [Gossypium arboreum]|uniref:Uncharacterized protein n=1 Tax=Gossypium arboreum TaxID=29729 RepID=A0A0B0NQB4_GOSAR|nr:hypothetical protein F383_00837 [Gossypium arboreum]
MMPIVCSVKIDFYGLTSLLFLSCILAFLSP